MNTKTLIMTAVVWTALGVRAVHAQVPQIPPPNEVMSGLAPSSTQTYGPVTGQVGKYQLSSWIKGDGDPCCGQTGEDGPIQTELFLRIGPSIVAGNGTVADVLQTGLYLGGGGRVLFFDLPMSSAWTIELSVANINNHAHAGPTAFPLEKIVPQDPANPATPRDATGNLPPQRVFFGKDGLPGVTLRSLNRTFFNVGGGKEWYLWGNAHSNGNTARVGFDAGGRWGSASAQFNEIQHKTDVIGGVWAAAHGDVEFPICGCCVLQAGFRVEYGYTWSDILQIQNKSDVQDINLLFNIGMRF